MRLFVDSVLFFSFEQGLAKSLKNLASKCEDRADLLKTWGLIVAVAGKVCSL